MATRTSPVLAQGIRITDTHLVVVTAEGQFEIPWERCSSKLGKATHSQRACAELSPSGYGIHWPLLDEDLAVGPLIASAELMTR